MRVLFETLQKLVALLLAAAFFLHTGPLQAQTKKQFIVCIDPGHPSETSSGAVANGLSENQLNWSVAVRLARKLNQAGILWVSTKQNLNEKVSNQRRAEIANGDNRYRNPASAMLRLHCDVGSGRGYIWYYPDRTGRKGAVAGPSQTVQKQSHSLAWTMNEAMKPVLNGHLKYNSLRTEAGTYIGGKQGGVLTASLHSKVPTALIEMCFINQKSDARFIASASGQERMAEALFTGIKRWKIHWEKVNP